MHEYLSSPTRHVHLRWYPYRIGYESCDLQTFCWSLPNKWWMHQSFSTHPSLWSLHLSLLIFQQPNSFCHFLVSWPLITCIFQCSKLMTIWSGVSLKSIVMAEVLCSRTSLWLWMWFPFDFRPDHWLVTRLIQHPLASHIPFLLWFHFFSLCGSYHWFFGFHKLYFLGAIDRRTTLSNISQFGSVWERFFMRTLGHLYIDQNRR